MSNSTSATMNRSSTNNVETIVQSGKSVEQVIARDQAYPDLLTLLNGPTSDMYIKSLLSPTEDLLETHSVPIPQALMKKIHEKSLDSRCFWGVFPEIGRAWLSIDHQLYIWNYSNPIEIYEYNDQDQIIITLGLIKPKAGIFEDNITHLLAISTPLQIIILALSVSATGLKVFATDMVVPADDVQMKVIKGTEDGRIFMIGNGKPYEFMYKHPNSWGFGQRYSIQCKTAATFTRFLPTLPALPNFVGRRKLEEPPQIKSLAIDDERKLLYLLTDTSIEVVDLSHPTKDYISVFKHTTIIETAIQMCRQNSRTYPTEAFTLVSAHVISKAESKKVHLMAITAAGFRLYFSTQKDAFRQTMAFNDDNSNLKATTLELGHVRLPPTDALLTVPGQPNSAVGHTYYDCGVCLYVKPFNEDVDSIYCSALAPSDITPPATPQPVYSTVTYNQPRPVYVETMSTTKTSAKTWAITESRVELKGKRHMKEISEEISDTPRQFVVLSSTSIVFYNKLRPVDVLLYIIQKENRTQQEELKDYETFFGRYGKIESCSMCLSIICNADNEDTIRKATKLFLELGGSPTSSTAAQTTGNHLGQVVGQTGITYSGRHDGFVLYLARLLTPVWKLKVFEKCDPSNPDASIWCTKIHKLLYEVRCNLEKLKRFMDANPQFHDSANISDPRFQADRSRLELDLAEQRSVRDKFLLLSQAIDAVFFLEFLLDSQMNTTFTLGSYDFNQLRQFFGLDISSMIITSEGREVASALAVFTIGEYGKRHTIASFDIVSYQLERNCSNFFGVKDILFFKGMEYIKLARNAEVDYDRDSSVKKSLNCFKEAADQISYQKMNFVCQFYLDFSYHVGIVELALERAHKLDPNNQAEAANEGRSQDDTKNALLRARLGSYDFALNAFNDLLRLKSQPFPPNRIPIEDLGIYYRNVFDTAIKSKDKIFHEHLYKWFMDNGLQEELLLFETPYLVSYFKKNGDNDESSLEFLWKYYRSKCRYMDAAVCLFKLATSNSPSLNLKSRTQYLSFAHVNAQSEPEPQGREIEFTNHIRKMLKDSQLQVRVQETLRSNEGIDAQLAADFLDTKLLDRDVLFRDFGSKFHFLVNIFEDNQ